MYDSVVVLGPTACGKTVLGARLAFAFHGEVLSADCRQVYKGLDIGSGKDLGDFTVDGPQGRYTVPYHLIDIAELSQEYNLFRYQQDFMRVFKKLCARNILPVVVGGTGMYLDAVIRGYDMDEVPVNKKLRSELDGCPMEELALRFKNVKKGLHNTTDILERPRLIRAIEIAEYKRDRAGPSVSPRPGISADKAIRPLILGTSFPREELRERIEKRLHERFDAGMIDEVQSLYSAGVSWERLERLGLEYKYIAEYLQGKYKSEQDMAALLNRAICRFAKRQETWFRGMERKGVQIHWLSPDTLEKRCIEAHDLICQAFRSSGQGFCLNDVRDTF